MWPWWVMIPLEDFSDEDEYEDDGDDEEDLTHVTLVVDVNY